jgi:predicted RNA binding protein YcfA (HicA-like mRNA interferase family)
MPPFGAISRKDLIKFLKKYGFEGLHSGGKHQFMVKENVTLRVPNPHQGDIGKSLLVRILRQANISKEEWEEL